MTVDKYTVTVDKYTVTVDKYTVTVDKYKDLLHQNITKGYKVSTDGKKDDNDKRTNTLAQKPFKIENKMEQHTKKEKLINK